MNVGRVGVELLEQEALLGLLRGGLGNLVATIVFAEGEAADAASIFAACREQLEPNFVPSYLQVLEEIPKTASEKPQERILLQEFDPDAAHVHTEPGR